MLEPDKWYLLLKATSTNYNDLACLAKSAATKFPEPDIEKYDGPDIKKYDKRYLLLEPKSAATKLSKLDNALVSAVSEVLWLNYILALFMDTAKVDKTEASTTEAAKAAAEVVETEAAARVAAAEAAAAKVAVAKAAVAE